MFGAVSMCLGLLTGGSPNHQAPFDPHIHTTVYEPLKVKTYSNAMGYCSQEGPETQGQWRPHAAWMAALAQVPERGRGAAHPAEGRGAGLRPQGPGGTV